MQNELHILCLFQTHLNQFIKVSKQNLVNCDARRRLLTRVADSVSSFSAVHHVHTET